MSSAQTLNPIQSVSFSQQHLPHCTKNAGTMTNTATVGPVSNIQAFHDTRLLQESLPKLCLDSFRVILWNGRK